jgi:hypothetical protein
VVYTLLLHLWISRPIISTTLWKLWNLYWDLGHSTGSAASISNFYRLLPHIISLTDRLINPNRALLKCPFPTIIILYPLYLLILGQFLYLILSYTVNTAFLYSVHLVPPLSDV